MPAENLVFFSSILRYDGTNSTEILDLFPDTFASENVDYPKQIASEGNGVLIIDYTDGFLMAGSPWQFDPINVGDAVTSDPDYPAGTTLPVRIPASSLVNTVSLSDLINP